MCFAQPDFPGKTGVLDGGQWRRTGTAVVPADGDNVRARLGYARGNDADSGTGNEFYADARARIDGAQVVYQLREVFDAVNVVMWRRRNQRGARRGVPDARDVFADFLGGQLAALTGLRALRHLDFKFFGVDEIIRGDSETPRGDLLDLVGRGWLEAIGIGIFAALAGIAPATKLIHGQCQSAVRLRAERAERHRLCAETLDDGLQRLDLLERNGRVRNGVEQVPQKNRALMLRQFFKRRVGLRPGRAHMGVKAADDLRRIRVKFRVFPEPVKTCIHQFIGFAGEGRFVQAQIIGEEIVQRLLTRIVGSVFKYFRAKILGETHDLKEMAVAITSKRGNAHAGENFAQPGIDGRPGFFRAARFKGFRKLIRKVWDNGAGASRHKQRHVMRVKNLRRFDNQRHIPQAFANHRFPHGRGRKQGRQRRASGIDRTIGKEEEPRAPAAAQRGSRKLSKTAARPRDSSGGKKSNIDSLLGSKNRGELRKLSGRNQGTRQRDAIFQVNIERHHVGFAQRVDRRVRDLREPLLAVVPQSSRERGKKCGRSVISHAPVRFFAAGQRGKESLELIFRPAGSAGDALWFIDGDRRYGDRRGQHSLRNRVARLLDREALEDVAPAQKEPGGGIGKNHFSGA